MIYVYDFQLININFIFSEMILPMTANVYYAINTKYELNFLLRKKKVEL